MDHRAALGAELDHQGGRGQFTHGAQGGEQVFTAAGNQEFLFGADDQVETRQDLLHMLADILVGDETGFAIGLAGQAPQHGAVVDVQHALDVVPGRVIQGLEAGLVHAVGGEMRTGDQQRFAGGDKGFADVFGAQGHVGAVFAVEHQGEGFAVLEAQQDQGGEALRVDLDATDITAFAGQGFHQETAHVVIADPAQHRRLQPQPGGAESDVGGRSAQILGEAGHILKPRTDLLRIEIDAQAPEANQIQLTPTGKTSLAHAGSCYFYQPALCRRGDGKRSWWEQTRTSGGSNQYLFHNYF